VLRAIGKYREPVTGAAQWLPRCALGWLLVAQFALIVPHLPRLPPWVIGIWLLAAAWRVMMLRGRWGLPSRWLKHLMLLLAVVGVRLHFGSFVGLEPTVALLISAFCLKLFEASRRRDAYLLLFLGFFVAATQFLFDQSLFSALYMVLPVLLLVAALEALQRSDRDDCSLAPLRSALLLSAQALPLMVLLFLVMPRFAPLWQVPMARDSARTGMSEEMGPGDIANLSQSAGLAFRAVFDAAVPPPAMLYWRGLVLDQFDGRHWRPGRFSDTPRTLIGEERPRGVALDYQVFLEPTGQRWLFALERPQRVDQRTLLTYDYRLVAFDPLYAKFAYRARALPEAPLDLKLDSRLVERNLQLPRGADGEVANNPRTRAWIDGLRLKHRDDAALVQALLDHFRREPFVYTLRPPPLGADAVDEFLFDTRRGFCEHYASAFTFALRAAGVPARVVVGYQGGEVNPLNGTVLVHQFDAHAWSEVWLEGRGWVRFDPTAAVAPQRIERGLESAVASGEFLADSPLSVSRYRGVAVLNRLRLQLDQINYQWTRLVLNYRDDTQQQFLQQLLGGLQPWRIAAFLVGGGLLLFGTVALLLFWRRRPPPLPPAQRLYQQLCRRLARLGYPRPAGMAPGDYARHVAAQQPQLAWVAEATRCFEALSYRPLSEAQRRALLKRLRRLVRTSSL
jgi:transglutaminase-like putative cysteine protease